MKRIFLFITLFLVSLVSVAQNMQKMSDVSHFEEALKSSSQKIQSVESNFKQEKFMRVFSEKVESSGMFFYRKPNKISLLYNKPVQYDITINGNKLQTVVGGKKTTVNLGSNKMMTQMKGLIEASMIGNLAALKVDFTLDYYHSSLEYFVKIVPVSNAVRGYIKEVGITFDKKTIAVKRLRITEQNGDYTDYIFSNTKYNTLQNDEKFSIR